MMGYTTVSALQNLYAPAIAAASLYLVFSALALLALPALLAIYLLSVLLGARSSRRITMENDSERMGSAMLALHGMLSSRLPLLDSIPRLVGRIKSADPAYAILSRLHSRARLGQLLDSAIASESESVKRACNADVIHAIDSVKQEYSSTLEVRHSLLHGHERIMAGVELRRTRASASMGRYLILSMVFSTVVPSLMLFGFISYSIIAYSSVAFLVFSIALLVAMPGITNAIGVKINELSQ